MNDQTSAPIWHEVDRIKALQGYDVLDTPHEDDFEDIVKLAAQICNAPISLISFVATNRQWFKAAHGTTLRETPLNVSICSHAIKQSDIFVIPDTTKDPRTQDNSLVTGDPHVRFYAGAPLTTAEGTPIGTVCVLDYQPRELKEHEAATLKALARQVMTLLELRRALKDRNASETRLTLALEASGVVGVWDWDIVNDRVVADSPSNSIFNSQGSWKHGGIPLSDYLKAVLPNEAERVQTDIATAIKTREIFLAEFCLKHEDGSPCWLEARGRCVYDEAGKPIHFPGVAVDVTNRKLSEQKVHESTERFRFLAESFPHKIFTAKPNGDVDFFNQPWTDFTGLTFEQIRDWGWTQFIHPDDLEMTLNTWREAILKIRPFEMEHRFRRHDGVYRWHLSRGYPMRNPAGELVIWMGSNTDIDDRRQEKEILERTVHERTKELKDSISELEAFSYSISHDMRAPLRAMLGFSEILKDDYASNLDEKGRHCLDRIMAASTRMDMLIQDVLSFSRTSRAETNLVRVDLDQLVRSIITTYPNLSAPDVEISFAGSIPAVLGNEGALTQCVSNVLGNAVKFVQPGVLPKVLIRSGEQDGRVKIWFEDNGIGIAPSDIARIFDIFHRVDRKYEGTGIGLAIVKKAAEKMGGHVSLESEPGRGSSFCLELQGA